MMGEAHAVRTYLPSRIVQIVQMGHATGHGARSLAHLAGFPEGDA